jgi:hypothetical protein
MANTLELGNGKWATGKDTVLAFNDQNNNFKPLPFSFSRASSGTVVNKEGLIETVGVGEPRIDFKDNTKGALLLEPSRTNLFPYSEDFSQSNWIKSNSTITSGFISPNGDNNAYEVNMISSTANLYENIGVSAQTDYTLSFYAKKGTATDVSYRVYDSSNLSDIISETSYYSQLSTDWVRIEISFTTPLGCSQINSFLVRSSTNFGTVLIYGAQLEQGSYATSYIPTSGSAVTRVADVCNNENLNVDYSGDYTLYLEHETFSLTEYNQLQFRQETSISYIFRVGNSINIGTNLYTTANTIGFNKFALSVTSSGSYNFYKNGVLLSSGSGLNANLETIRTATLGMSIKDLKLYNTALTDQELIALTQ